MAMRFTLTGAEELARDVRGVADRARSPQMGRSAERMAEILRRNLITQRLGGWPPLAPGTVQERQRLGFGAGPPLVRTGSLRDSIRALATGAGFAEAGSDDPRAAILDAKRPFIGFLDEDAEPLLAPILDDIFQGVA